MDKVKLLFDTQLEDNNADTILKDINIKTMSAKRLIVIINNM